MKRAILPTVATVMAASLCFATKMMHLQGSIDVQIDIARDVVIATCHGKSKGPHEFDVTVLKSLKGATTPKRQRLKAVFNQMTAGYRYLIFAYGASGDGTLIANGELTPLPIPRDYDLRTLDKKPIKEQIVALFTARLGEVERIIRELQDEKQLLDKALYEKTNDT